MKRSAYKYLIPLVVLMVWIACKKPYNPTINDTNLNHLVIEGTINTGGVDTTFIKLSRSSNISNGASIKFELKAAVKVEADNNTSYNLTEKGAGVYYLAPLNLGFMQKFRLRVKTSDGKEYLSDYVEAKQAPAIDALNYKADKDELSLFVDSHDASNNTRYYRWEFVETWEYYAAFYSSYVSDGTKVVARDMVNNQVYHCWNTATSNTVIIASTLKLAQDVVSNQLVTTIEGHSPKITVRYSILLKQYALTAAEFTYWDNIKKNNENLGSIFDSQPSDNQSNIHCISNTNETVVGYIGAGAYTSKRIFIDKSQIPIVTYPLDNCVLDTVYLKRNGINEENLYFNIPQPTQIPIDALIDIATRQPVAHTGTSPDCADCRLKGGVTRKPPFWP